MNDTVELRGRPLMQFEDRSIPQIRNMKEAYDVIKERDPETSITYFAFRRDVVEGKIPRNKNGNRYYVNLHDVWAYYRDYHSYDDRSMKVS